MKSSVVNTFGHGENTESLPSLLAKIKDHKSRRPSEMAMDRDRPDWYHQLIQYAKDRRSCHHPAWRLAQREYNIGKRVTEYVNEETLALGRIYSLVHITEGMLSEGRPKIFVEGFTAEDHEGVGEVFQTGLNNEWRRDFSLRRELKTCIRDTVKFGVGIMLTSFFTDDETDDEEVEGIRDEAAEDPILAEVLSVVEAEIGSQEALRTPEETQENFEGDSRVQNNRLVSRRIDPRLFYADPDAESIEDARFFFREIESDVAVVKADPLLKNTNNLQGCSKEHTTDSAFIKDKGNHQGVKSPYETVTLYEFFERMPGGKWRILVLAENHDAFLLKKEDPFWIGHPVAVLRWNEDGEEFYPQSDVSIVMPEVMAEKILFTKTFQGFNREQVDTTFIDEDAGITEEKLHELYDPEIGKIIKVSGVGNRPISQMIYRLGKDQKSPEGLNLLGMIERGIQVTSGLGPNQFGQALKSGTTATEAAEVGGFARSRGGHKLSAVEEFVSRISYQRLGLMLQFYSAADVVRLVGKEAALKWARARKMITRQDVRNGLSVIVDPGSMRPVSDEVRVSQLINFFGITNQDPIFRALVNPVEGLKELAKRLGFHEGSKLLNDPDPNVLAKVQAMVSASQVQGGGGQQGSPPAPSSGTPTQQAQG